MTQQSTFKPGKGIGQPVGVAVLGMGTVGTEVVRLMDEYAEEFAARIGGPLELKGIAVSDLEKQRPGVPAELLTDDAMSLVERDDVDIVVEVIGGIDYPRRIVLAALNAGKSVVTANKALVAAHADELDEAAPARVAAAVALSSFQCGRNPRTSRRRPTGCGSWPPTACRC